ncbi:putative Putative diacyglycerol O-acyltransferase [Candidatus Promineifilum breve]|uniref:diacylglycerol O-acyltransferase n=1 Tax=Candidatus Promineifilum breve TaxID=1806508 RepID=A0A160T3B2_9CHLR|nr:wax ester/triacylglycerol synthase family O-acyltransferase [Candidatus Promineifilum breve]CUS04486.2 putative Putative diacyglycerol O-acyltransferase [Candidatus Promineifilum breve]
MAATITPLANVDAAWLKMEDPTNLMMVTGVLMFPRPVDMDYFRALIESRLLQFDRFRQRVVRPSLPLAPHYWEFDPHFNVNAHLHRIGLPHPHDKSALQQLVSELMSTGLDFSKPLWHMHVVDGYGEGGAVIVRLHHALADGMALVGVLLALTDMNPGAPRPTPNGHLAAAEPDALAPPSPLRGSWEALQLRAAEMAGRGVGVGRRALIEGLETYLNNDRPRQLAEMTTDYAHAAGKLVLRAADNQTIFKGELGIAKRAVWSRPLPLSEVKAMRQALGVTVNDLMIAAVAGGLRRYLEGRGEEAVDFRAAVPVNLRGPHEMGGLGNKFGLVFLDLPVATVDMPRRLALVRYRMEALKNSHEAPVALDILGAIGFSAQMVQDAVVRMIGSKATAVMTNVPGPPIPLYLAGQPIERMMFWVPQSGRLGLGLSVLSYAGNIYLGIASDAGLVPDPDGILLGFYAEYDELLGMV